MNKFHFWILTSSVLISGLIQGMLLPVVAIIFEQEGVASSINGIHATGMYIGVLLISPFIEKPLITYGFKKIAIIGVSIVVLSLLSFSLFSSIGAWFLLRLLIGIGDHMFHFSTQTWFMAKTTSVNRGKLLAIYGLFFGAGFALGPVFAKLILINTYLPFLVAAALACISLSLVFFLDNEYPEKQKGAEGFMGSIRRMGEVLSLAWIALVPPFVYGFIEASLNGNFPVYALRENISISNVSLILPAFAIGGIITQIPIGSLSDRYGRNNVLRFIFAIGGSIFLIGTIGGTSLSWLLLIFLLAGMVTGSTYSLGMSYMADLLPNYLLPAGNLLCGIFFSVGSMIGPTIGGVYLDLVPNGSFFIMPTIVLAITFIIFILAKKKTIYENVNSSLSA